MPNPKLLDAILRALAGAGRGTRLPGALRQAPRLARMLPGRGGRALPGLGSAADAAPDIARVARGPVRMAMDVAPPGLPELRMAGEGLPPYPGRTPGRGLVKELSDRELAEAAREAWWRSEMAVERPAGDLSYAEGLRAVGTEESVSRKLAEIQSEWMRRRGTGGLEASLMGEGAPPRKLPSVSEFDQLDAAVLEGMDVSMGPGRTTRDELFDAGHGLTDDFVKGRNVVRVYDGGIEGDTHFYTAIMDRPTQGFAGRKPMSELYLWEDLATGEAGWSDFKPIASLEDSPTARLHPGQEIGRDDMPEIVQRLGQKIKKLGDDLPELDISMSPGPRGQRGAIAASEYDQAGALPKGADVSMAPGRGRPRASELYSEHPVSERATAEAEGLDIADLDQISEHGRRYTKPAKGAEKAVSEIEKEAELDWIAGMSPAINRYLRTGKVVGAAKEDLDELVRQLDRLVESGVVQEDRLWRAVSTEQAKYEVGQLLTEPSFTSTTSSVDWARAMARGEQGVTPADVIFRIKNVKGTPGRALETTRGEVIGSSDVIGDEVLLPRNTTLRVTNPNAGKFGESTIVDVERVAAEVQITLPPMQKRLLARAGKPDDKFQIAVASPKVPLPRVAIMLNDGTVIRSAKRLREGATHIDLTTAPPKAKPGQILSDIPTQKRMDSVGGFLNEGGLRLSAFSAKDKGRVLYVQYERMTNEQVQALAPHLKDFDELVLDGPRLSAVVANPTVAKLRAAVARIKNRYLREFGSLPELGG